MSRCIKKLFLGVSLFVVLSASIPAFDVWQYPASADKDSIFAGVLAASFAFDFNHPPDSKFQFDYPEFYLDYVLPVGLPFFIGASVDSLHTGQYGLGIRPGYHINFDVPNLDAYVLYGTNFDISENRMEINHGVKIGLRYIFYDLFCVNVETGYRFERLHFGLSLKLN